MGRKNNSGRKQIRVTREIMALADRAAELAADPEVTFLAAKTRHSRRITSRMLKGLRSHAI
jgi:hypothetical protein